MNSAADSRNTERNSVPRKVTPDIATHDEFNVCQWDYQLQIQIHLSTKSAKETLANTRLSRFYYFDLHVSGSGKPNDSAFEFRVFHAFRGQQLFDGAANSRCSDVNSTGRILTPYNAPQQLSPSSLRVLSALCGLPLPAATPVTVTGTQLAARESNRGCPATTVPPSPQKMMDDRRSITIVITWQ